MKYILSEIGENKRVIFHNNFEQRKSDYNKSKINNNHTDNSSEPPKIQTTKSVKLVYCIVFDFSLHKLFCIFIILPLIHTSNIAATNVYIAK